MSLLPVYQHITNTFRGEAVTSINSSEEWNIVSVCDIAFIPFWYTQLLQRFFSHPRPSGYGGRPAQASTAVLCVTIFERYNPFGCMLSLGGKSLRDGN